MNKTVGIVGLGIMGGAIARNLVDRGWRVIGFDTDTAKCAELAAAKIVIAESVEQLTRDAPAIMTSLPTPAAVESVAKAIANSGETPRIVIELSTLTLVDKLRFEAILKQSGHIALDCPLSGTGAQARMRDLIVYASGDSAAIARCTPLFADFAKQSADLGQFGNGSRMKFVANLLVAVHNVATAEAIVLGVKAGLDPTRILEVIASGAGTSRIFELRGPMMVKDRFIKAYGRPDFTFSRGSSGGSEQQIPIADAYPGILDGIIPSRTFPDVLTNLQNTYDTELLNAYFAKAGDKLTEEQRLAIVGTGRLRDATADISRIDPRKNCPAGLPESQPAWRQRSFPTPGYGRSTDRRLKHRCQQDGSGDDIFFMTALVCK